MKILLVRHAQSGNNIVQAAVHKKFAAGKTTETQAQEEWLSLRMDDPALSQDGLAQLVKLKKHCRKVRKQAQIHGNIKMVCSPMTRACQTAKAVADAMGVSAVEVRGELCEVGGIYSVERKKHAGVIAFHKAPGRAMSSNEIQTKFTGFDTSRLPAQGPWDMGRGFEDHRAAVDRACRVAAWLRQPGLHQEIGPSGILIIVSHADFLALLMAALYNVQVHDAGMNPDLEIAAHCHRGGEQATQHLQQEVSVNAASVYQRFRISLAATTLLHLGENGGLAVEWMNKRSHLEANGVELDALGRPVYYREPRQTIPPQRTPILPPHSPLPGRRTDDDERASRSTSLPPPHHRTTPPRNEPAQTPRSDSLLPAYPTRTARAEPEPPSAANAPPPRKRRHKLPGIARADSWHPQGTM